MHVKKVLKIFPVFFLDKNSPIPQTLITPVTDTIFNGYNLKKAELFYIFMLVVAATTVLMMVSVSASTLILFPFLTLLWLLPMVQEEVEKRALLDYATTMINFYGIRKEYTLAALRDYTDRMHPKSAKRIQKYLACNL